MNIQLNDEQAQQLNALIQQIGALQQSAAALQVRFVDLMQAGIQAAQAADANNEEQE